MSKTNKAAPRALEDVLRELCRERALSLAEVVSGAETWCNRATVYRVMSGRTSDPALSTLCAICRALDVRPQEVVERAGLWAGQDGKGAARHAELRATWTAVACLPDVERARITQVVRALLGAARTQYQALTPARAERQAAARERPWPPSGAG